MALTANQLKVVDYIGNNVLARYVNSLAGAMTANREWEKEWVNKNFDIGDVLRIREPTYFNVTQGAALQIQAVQENQTDMRIEYQDQVSVKFTSVEIQRFLNDPETNVYAGAAQALANIVDSRILQSAVDNMSRYVGSAGSGVSTFGTVRQAKAMQTKMGVVNSKYLTMNPDDSSTLDIGLQNTFNEPLNKSISQDAVIGRIASLDCYEAQNLQAHTNGSFAGTPVVAGAGQTGEFIDLSGFTASAQGVLKKGDIIKFTTVYWVNPVNQRQIGLGTGNLASFKVVADVNADGAGLATVQITPPLNITAPYANVTNAPADTSAVTLVGSASGSYTNNIVYSPDALSFACVPGPMMMGAPYCKNFTDTDTGISMRLIVMYDPTVDSDVCRFDTFTGVKCFPGYGTMIIG